MMSIILLSFSPLRRIFTFRSISIVIILLLTIQIIFLHFVFNIFDGTHLVYQNRQFVENITCDIKDKQAISALKRMKTEKCRQRCIDVYCLIDSVNRGKLIGCYSLEEDTNSIKSKKRKLFLNIKNEDECLDACLQLDFDFAAQFSNQCICGQIDTLKSKCDNCSTETNQCLTNQLLARSTGLKKMDFYFPNEYRHEINEIERPRIRHNYLYKELITLETRFPNIQLARNRFASIWGGTSLLTTILSCLEVILLEKNWPKWDFVLNLSETDFPIKPLSELEAYLAANEGKNFIKSHGKGTHDFIQMQALNKIFVECEQHMWRIGNRNLIKGIVWDGGSDWIVLSNKFSHYLIFGVDPLIFGLKKYFQYSLLPAESFFHVVLRNSEFCSTIVNNNLRVTNWQRKRGCKCQHKNVVDWCGCSPNTFRKKDASRLASTNSRPFFFARKFEHTIDSDIIDFVEQRLLLNGLPLLDESVFLENIFNTKHDNDIEISQSKLAFYKEFGLNLKSILSENCHVVNNDLSTKEVETFHFEFIESNAYFENNKFFGLHLRYLSSNDDNTEFNYEVLLKRHQNDTFLLDSHVKPKLRNLKVCNRFDVKEDVFRDFECHIDQLTQIEILHEWELFFGHYNLTFIFLNDDNHVIFHQKVTINNTNSDLQSVVQLLNPLLPHSLPVGLCKILILNQIQVIGATKFIVSSASSQNLLTTMNRFHPLPLNDHFNDSVHKFMYQNHDFFDTTKRQFWYIYKSCYFQNELHLYQLKCVPSFNQTKFTLCSEVKWNSKAIESRYFFKNYPHNKKLQTIFDYQTEFKCTYI
ncbi:Xylosyltransferase 2 [Blomia tropicalis]|nr:Xylosyltransferase 2 [Blomia tropicalis]